EDGPPVMSEDPYAYVVDAFQALPSLDYVPSPEEPEQAPPSPVYIPYVLDSEYPELDVSDPLHLHPDDSAALIVVSRAEHLRPSIGPDRTYFGQVLGPCFLLHSVLGPVGLVRLDVSDPLHLHPDDSAALIVVSRAEHLGPSIGPDRTYFGQVLDEQLSTFISLIKDNSLNVKDVHANMTEYCVTLISVHKLAKDNKNVLGIGNQCGGLYYLVIKKHGRMILDSIDHGSLVYPTIEENGQTRPKKYSELTEAQQLQDDCDAQAMNIILHGLPPDVYALVNHQEVTKDI
nr:hypothetical protein [Tanacetum cinerariifolium]